VRIKLAITQLGERCSYSGMDLVGQRFERRRAGLFRVPKHDISTD
jgi:hypothetical protein